jgi:protein-disulfide isomerase
VRARQLLGTADSISDLAVPVDLERDHIRGPADAMITMVEYGDFECPYCGRAEPAIRELLAEFAEDLRYVFRELPLADVHPHAQAAAEAAEAADAQGAFWEMHDLLFAHQDALTDADLRAYAAQLGLDVERFSGELRRRVYAPRVFEDVDSADRSGVAGTPTFFVNGRRHHGAYDEATLAAAVRELVSNRRGSRPTTWNAAQPSADAPTRAPRMPTFASSSCSPVKARPAMNSATAKPSPPIAAAPTSGGQGTGRRTERSRVATHDPATMPPSLPAT